MQFISRGEGTKGKVKSSPEDFVVKEITPNGTVLEPGKTYTPGELGEEDDPNGKATRFVLQKRDWDTIKVLVEMAKRRGRGKKSIGYSGIKDRTSISTQVASVWGVTPDQISSVRMDGVSVNGAWRGAPLEMGSNLGNGFDIVIREPERQDGVAQTLKELEGGFPNYFDRQRFGYRLNNFSIGLSMLKGDFEGAVMTFLTDTKNEDNVAASEARKRLANDRDFKTALTYFPEHLRYERTVIDHMVRYDNYANALRRLPRGIVLLFIHAVESGIFNAMLEQRIMDRDFKAPMYCGANSYGFPNVDKRSPDSSAGMPLGTIIGYDTPAPYISEYEKAIMERVGITPESFRMPAMPELGMKGTYRPLLSPVKGINHSISDSAIKISFQIPSGSYATVLINEITKTDSFSSADLAPELG